MQAFEHVKTTNNQKIEESSCLSKLFQGQRLGEYRSERVLQWIGCHTHEL